ncbi:hypothetical protein [Oleiagrimonas soli]|uniref:Uncharacterized protein n=1 Tax=Oleiagrimonas soli TaxID=1543381 RepID=A0A099CW64_9GAMM|nr:hypothetical protein [Oleiagrimonas soli]KGI77877.1 hypothetical protein LF63_0105585 [Oleiagrimonas soli]MBB6183766.1 hypothetical protein [Oleiagrimonas soli]
MEENFHASVQYNDLKGSSAADDADMVDAAKFLMQNGHITEGEYVIGISMWAGENHGSHRDPVSVRFLVSPLDDADNIPDMIRSASDPLKVKEIRLDMNLVDFFALFKRFEVTLSNGGLVEGRTLQVSGT